VSESSCVDSLCSAGVFVNECSLGRARRFRESNKKECGRPRFSVRDVGQSKVADTERRAAGGRGYTLWWAPRTATVSSLIPLFGALNPHVVTRSCG
jgi:hypothetical protein